MTKSQYQIKSKTPNPKFLLFGTWDFVGNWGLEIGNFNVHNFLKLY